jgi:hypothetical protein
MRSPENRGMRRLLLVLGGVTLVLCGGAAATLKPPRTVVSAAPVRALALAGRTVVWAVSERDGRCAIVRRWDTATGRVRAFGVRRQPFCAEEVSTGRGISQVSTSGDRLFWTTYVGGNFRETGLWTATPSRPAPRRLLFVSRNVDLDPDPILLGAGTRAGVPYALDSTVTFVGDSGARLFRVTLPARVRLLTSGLGPGSARVLAALDDGSVVLLSQTGVVLRTEEHDPGEVRAIVLAPAGPLVQVGSTVSIGPAAHGRRLTLPSGAVMLDQREGRIVYRRGPQVRAREIATGDDSLLRVISVRPWQAMPFATGPSGSAWADGRVVGWRPGP